MVTREQAAAGELAATEPGGRTTAADTPVGPDAPILAVMSSMRAMRRLQPDPVPDEILRETVQAAIWAGSGGHLQRTRRMAPGRDPARRHLPVPVRSSLTLRVLAGRPRQGLSR